MLLVICSALPRLAAQTLQVTQLPQTETLQYSVEWRLINAGAVKVTSDSGGHVSVRLESAGLVARLYKLQDTYLTNLDSGFCAVSTHLDALEGKRHRETNLTIDRQRHKTIYLERDLLKNAVVLSQEIDTPECVHDIIGALIKLRTLNLSPGQSVQLPATDGKKFAQVKIEAQERENVVLKSGTRKTIRYEAFLFDGIIYKRKAKVNVWLTDDTEHLPVQIRVKLQFPVGTITLQLEKEEHR